MSITVERWFAEFRSRRDAQTGSPCDADCVPDGSGLPTDPRGDAATATTPWRVGEAPPTCCHPEVRS